MRAACPATLAIKVCIHYGGSGCPTEPPDEDAIELYHDLDLDGTLDRLVKQQDTDNDIICVAAAGCTAKTVGELIDEVAGLVHRGACPQASDYADAVNDGRGVVEGGGGAAGSGLPIP